MNITFKTLLLILVLTLLSCNTTFYADNEDNIKTEFLNKIATDYKLNDTIRLYSTWIGICGNDDRYNGEETKYPLYRSNFLLSPNSYTIKNKQIIVSSIEFSEVDIFLKKYPQSLKIVYREKGNKITYITKNKNKAKEYPFKIKWKVKY